VSRDWCIVLEHSEAATGDDVDTVEYALRMHEPAFDFDRKGDDYFVYVDAPHSVKRTQKAVLHALAESGVGDKVVTPLRVGRWVEKQYSFVFPDSEEEVEPVVSPDRIRWLVSVRPASAFVWRDARAELAARGRPVIDETNTAIRVGAADEEDARSLMAELKSLVSVGGAEAQRLGLLRRWLLREALVGNYAGSPDPTLPP
jgi:hypothetical protein